MKHPVLTVLICLGLLPALAAAGPATRPARRPNVIFVLIDDMGYADLSCYGQRAVATPHVDRLAKEGIRFTQFYVNAPICSPSRAALLTGQYPGRWRITSFLAERALNERRGMAQWLDPAAPNLRNNTLIVLASDNGPERGAGSAGIFRGVKGSLYEGGIREPLIAWGPGVLAPGAAGTVDDSSVIAGIDLFPSVLAVTGVATPAGVTLDGESRAGALLGRDPGPRATPLFWLRPPDRAGPPKGDWPDLATRVGHWKLGTDYDGGHPRLFDLAADPGERKNLADDQPARVGAMRAPLLAWYAQMPDSRRER